MKSITIRKVPEEVHRSLRVRAARNGRSLESELRVILTALSRPKKISSAPAENAAIALTEKDKCADLAMRKVRKILQADQEAALEQA